MKDGGRRMSMNEDENGRWRMQDGGAVWSSMKRGAVWTVEQCGV